MGDREKEQHYDNQNVMFEITVFMYLLPGKDYIKLYNVKTMQFRHFRVIYLAYYL